MTARTEAQKFGTFDLTAATNGVRILRFEPESLHEVKWSPKVAGGSLTQDDRRVGWTVRLGGIVFGSDSGDARDKVDALVAALGNGEQYLQFFSDRRLLCRVDSGSLEVKLRKSTQGSMYEWQCRMRSRFPFWEGSSTVSQSFAPTGAGPHSLVISSNAATHPVPPRISITTNVGFSLATLRLTLTGTTKQIEAGGLTMISGETIVFDCKEKRLGDGLTSPKTPTTLQFSPTFALAAGAANTLEIVHTVGGSANWLVDVDYEATYWGW